MTTGNTEERTYHGEKVREEDHIFAVDMLKTVVPFGTRQILVYLISRKLENSML